MDNRRKQAVCALMTALTVLVTAAFAPAEGNTDTVEFRLYLLDCFR